MNSLPVPVVSDRQAREIAGSARAEYNGAILVCDEPEYEAGSGWVGPPVQHQFAIRNDGSNSAWVRVYYSLGGVLRPCITEVESGETIHIAISMRSDKLRGRFEKLITVRVLPDSSEPVEQPWCIRRPLENACEATPTNPAIRQTVP